MKMKKLIALLLALVLVFAMAACGAKTEAPAENTPPAAENEPAAEKNEEPAEKPAEQPAQEPAAEEPALSGSITLMASQNWIKDIDQELFDKFEAETGVEVKVLLTPDNGYETLLGTTLAGGSDTVDMFMYHAGSKMLSAGIPELALDLSNEPWVANMEDWAINANTVDGKLLGFSTWGVDYEGILYNRTMFEENGWEVPTTWDEFMSLCDTIQAAGYTPLYEGINGTWHTEQWFYALTPVLENEHPGFVDDLNAGTLTFAELESVSAGLEQIKELLGHQPAYFTNDGQSEDWFGSYIALQNRECVMMATYSAYAAELAANGSTDVWGMFPVPVLNNTVGVSNGGGVSKYINKNSKNIDLCKALLNFLAQDENLEAYYAARSDLVSASFKDVESVSATTATTEMLERSTATCPVRMNNDVLYWDPNIYSYMQGFAAGTTSVEDFVSSMDAHRATMFETAAD